MRKLSVRPPSSIKVVPEVIAAEPFEPATTVNVPAFRPVIVPVPGSKLNVMLPFRMFSVLPFRLNCLAVPATVSDSRVTAATV